MASPTLDPKAQLAQRWIGEIQRAETSQEKWLQRCRRITKKYKSERSEEDTVRRYAMLWSNTQTIIPAVYARPPEAVVSRRFKDADPVGRVASEVLERALSFSIDDQDLDATLGDAAFDFVLLARGTVWERYVPSYGEPKTAEVKVVQVTTDAGVCYEDDDGRRFDPEVVTEDPAGVYTAQDKYRPVTFERSVTDFVNYEDFGHTPARTWDEVTYVFRRVFMSRVQLMERFGDEIGKAVKLDFPAARSDDKNEVDHTKRAAIYEVWDKTTRKVCWISKSYNIAPLDERDDPLDLEEFFPCPRPLYGTLANDNLLPTADYVYYQDQAEEIDVLTAKIGELQQLVKLVGFYAGEGKKDLAQMIRAPNTLMIPVAEWQGLKEDGGVKGRLEWWPIEKVVEAIRACIELRAQLINDVYQITGVSDILRGASDPRETASAQNVKAQWGSLRIRERQKEMARFSRDVLRIKAQVIAEKFSAETLAQMTGVKLPTAQEKQQAQAAMMQAQATQQQPPAELQQVLQSPTWEDVTALLQNNAARTFRIDIETDSTVEPNEQEEKAQTVELMGALSQMIQTWGPAVQQAPQLGPMFAELVKFAVRRFRAGREVEAVIDQALDQLIANPPQQGGEAPDQTGVQEAQIGLETEKLKQQGTLQVTQMKAQMQGQKIQQEQQNNVLKLQLAQRDPDPQVQA